MAAAAMAKGTAGIAATFANTDTNERFPVSHSRSGRSEISAAIVVANISMSAAFLRNRR